MGPPVLTLAALPREADMGLTVGDVAPQFLSQFTFSKFLWDTTNSVLLVGNAAGN